ncbi:uncharacterized protein HMPREF1541_02036 [Cyphellophora europaea CBS 101466]|uniref:C2H2-type domain-containing protein n=1 Tax=Cyphellophora europaea (strain CBS 101466) TaxID=1220924 RepID=W2S4B7_CYPE1|nr:uncharacterized protein HMPREF1541_02036 [Cyphellophora europaea CBS 101466]ETN42878.1 hypothetical protein HMPREF1541_02036 [Cyphellophora europaea CBS 101466]
MARGNQLVLDEDDDEYSCNSCDRSFGSRHAALQHASNASIHRSEWCNRCSWLFISPDALRQHLANSSLHNHCDRCNYDVGDLSDLARHREDVHFQCCECMKVFQNQNNLRMHKQVHFERDVECYGCDREFATTSAMVLHLERGTCGIGTDSDDIADWALGCIYADMFTTNGGGSWSFECPGCNATFRYVSGLLQHIESDACDQELWNNPIDELLDLIESEARRLL